jgi:hypothetical protein
MGIRAEGKARENRARYLARKQHCELVKSRTRNPQVWDYGLWWLTAPGWAGGAVYGAGDGTGLVGDPPGLTLDQVERHLTSSFWTPER